MASTLQAIKLSSSFLHLPSQLALRPQQQQKNWEPSSLKTINLNGIHRHPSSVMIRRSLVASLLLAVWSARPETANAARIKAAPSKEKRPEDDKNLSKLDAKVLANIRRKEELKAAVAALKEKGKAIK